MFFRITSVYFRRLSWSRTTPVPSRPVLFDQDAPEPVALPAPAGQNLRRWGALLALAGLALPGLTTAQLGGDGRPAEMAVVEASRTDTNVVAGVGAGGGLPGGDAWVAELPGAAHAAGIGGTPPGPRDTAAAPWEAGVVEADGKPLPSAPPPGPVPVDGIPEAAGAPAAPATIAARPAAPTGSPAPGETIRAVPNQPVAASAGPSDDLVPADREYLRPILIRYAQENGLPADLVMSLAWVESSWRRNTVSDAGAVGVMQLMPNTVEYVSKKLLGLRSNLDPRNPTSNVRMGTKYLRHLLNQNRGSVRQALIAYNQGLTSLRANGSYSVAERYADRVLALRPQFRTA